MRQGHLSFPSPFYRRKLRYREVKLLPEGYTAAKCRVRVSAHVYPIPKFTPTAPIPGCDLLVWERGCLRSLRPSALCCGSQSSHSFCIIQQNCHCLFLEGELHESRAWVTLVVRCSPIAWHSPWHIADGPVPGINALPPGFCSEESLDLAHAQLPVSS